MMTQLKTLLAFLPGNQPPVHYSAQTAQALRQLNNRYVRQKYLWIYIILSSIALAIVYVMFSIFWSELRDRTVLTPAAWIMLAGIGISIFQVRRCNDVIRTLRQAHAVQVQIEKAQAEKEAQEAAEANNGAKNRTRRHP